MKNKREMKEILKNDLLLDLIFLTSYKSVLNSNRW